MFGLGWTEILVIAAIAVLVVPTKDLPGLMRNVGQGIGKMRRMANQFQRELDAAIRDEELDKLRKEVTQIGRETEQDLRSVGSKYQRDVKSAAKVEEIDKTQQKVSQAGLEVEQALQRVGAVGRQSTKRNVTVEKPNVPPEPAMTPLANEAETAPAEEPSTADEPDEPVAETATPEPEPAKS